ncbi:MAG: hypothetical protein HYT12_01070 [Candidatus Liptonbacteria bacterium]|nr:hypothetical protein [Candidatus Liptonbacteria bacterium]
MERLLQKFYRRRKAILITVAVVVIFGYTIWSSVASREALSVPETFWESKRESVTAAEEIAAASRDVSENMRKIKELESAGRYLEALKLIREEAAKVSGVREKSASLLGELSNMTKGLPDVKPEGARALALEAINYQIGLVDHAIAYNNGLEYILRLLTAKVLYNDDVKKQLDEKIEGVNEEVRVVLDLNIKFNEAIQKLENY